MSAVKVTFLGTGNTGDPSRRCGSTAVSLPDGTVILVDTSGGNEIWHALREASIDVARIRLIILTHQHLDHAAGLPFVLFRLAMAGVPADGHRGPIDVCAPAAAVDDLRRMCEILFPGMFTPWWIGDRVRWHGCTSDQYVWGLELRDDGTTSPTTARLGTPGDALPEGVIATISTMAVSHGAPPVPAQAVRIDAALANGEVRRVVISGDTGPNLGFTRFAGGVDLLIHEAIESESLGANPFLVFGTGHVTAASAGKVAAASRVKRLALHHLNARTGQHPETVRAEAAEHFTGEILVPNDLDTTEV
ncbi:MAG: MBL fold metallo-hydrolase [Chloroflexi bacterium]|nr:MBL fold metallo-hydrolase [Chloroflexota bacterium]